MFVELVYDKRNFDGLPGAKDIILGELIRRIHRIFPDASILVNHMKNMYSQFSFHANINFRSIRSMYNRSVYLDSRREMMQWWADWLDEKVS